MRSRSPFHNERWALHVWWLIADDFSIRELANYFSLSAALSVIFFVQVPASTEEEAVHCACHVVHVPIHCTRSSSPLVPRLAIHSQTTLTVTNRKELDGWIVLYMEEDDGVLRPLT